MSDPSDCPRCGGAVSVDLSDGYVSCYGECCAYIQLSTFRREHAERAEAATEPFEGCA